MMNLMMWSWGWPDVEKMEAEKRWLAVGRLHNDHPFSATTMLEQMKFIWNLVHTPRFREAGENLFIFQMFCLGDWKKIVHGGSLDLPGLWTDSGWL